MTTKPFRSRFPLVLLCLLLLPCLSGCGSQAEPKEESKALEISLSDLTGEPLFVDWEQDGQPMQLIALQNAQGEVQVAYNTCQSCAGSPWAYFEYRDGALQCQNCGIVFPLSSVGAVAGGCNPKPVADYVVTENRLTISAQELATAAQEFVTWKKFD